MPNPKISSLTIPVLSDGIVTNQTFDIRGSGGSGGGESTRNVTANIDLGGIESGTTIPSGTDITEFMEKLLIAEIPPTITFSASGDKVVEAGESITPTLTLSIVSSGTGTPTYVKFYNGNTLLDTQTYSSGTSTYTYTMGPISNQSDPTVKGVLEYDDSEGSSESVEKTAEYYFVLPSYYGAVSSAPTTEAGVESLTKVVQRGKELTAIFNLSNQRACYCYRSTRGDLSSIKDANSLEYISGYTKSTVIIDGAFEYNVYTQNDPVTITGFVQNYT